MLFCIFRSASVIFCSITLFALVAVGHRSAAAGNDQCWGDIERQDVSCRELTEPFLLSMRHAPRSEVVAVMGVAGRRLNTWTHYISNYGKGLRDGAGIVNFTFDSNDRVTVIFASSDQAYQLGRPTMSREFMRNAAYSEAPISPDFLGSNKRCQN